MTNPFLSSEPAAVLVGLPFYPPSDDVETAIVIVVAVDAQYDVPNSTRPFWEFMQMPRPVREAAAWLAEAGEPSDTVARLAENGKLILVPPGPGGVAAFTGFRLFSNCRLLERPAGQEPADGILFVGDPGSPETALPISSYLAHALWHSPDGEDFPACVGRLARSAGIDESSLAEDVLTWLPGLLGSGYGFFGPAT